MRGRSVERILGVVEGRRPGRTVIAIGGMHGNEPAGLDAVQTVLRELSRRNVDLAGKLVGVAGNLQAIAADRRYLERDLNRGWTPQTCERVAKPRPGETPEDAEQRGLLEVFGPLEAESPQPLVFVDLHSTSGPAAPFSIIPDVTRNRELALRLPIPTVLGLEEILEGVMFGYLVDRGHMGVAIEGGQHEDPRTAALLEAVIWLTLVEVGNLDARHVPGGVQAQRERLRSRAEGLPPGVRILQRHGTSPGDGFQMEPGFDNFSPVRAGQRLATDHDGPIHASEDGLVMLPRYQGQGSDGFFLAKAITRRWLMASALARKGTPARLLAAWPGLHWDASNPNRLRYDGTEPPAPMMRTLRLLGYHGVRARPPGLEFFRRRP
ncbi:succinylglutamate desuccinylase/aspartoacylase family protein [Paraliomyxa miuraensis]|uniref:succinylglutamate desuccinylase/aspartoacylase family protein n=1 Tax=Paraliomyxa miuraensis TaxID=376150 RepID=UPI0022541602|nr:succinylglutamate desuccinylase/aspartoacylase family protein [Paraliomyxa miuraensis]MCX4242726.1 succinylglutamate desuccinylase/aspartoacylase family protein [Paraliomyxa miuraensis]